MVGSSGLEKAGRSFAKSALSFSSDRTFRACCLLRKTATPKDAATPIKAPTVHPSAIPILAPVLRPEDPDEAVAVTVVCDTVLGLVAALVLVVFEIGLEVMVEANAEELLGMDEDDDAGVAVEPIPQVVGERFGSWLFMTNIALPFPEAL